MLGIIFSVEVNSVLRNQTNNLAATLDLQLQLRISFYCVINFSIGFIKKPCWLHNVKDVWESVPRISRRLLSEIGVWHHGDAAGSRLRWVSV